MKLQKECKSLHTLNIGYNHLTDEVLISISATLPFTKTLNGLGLQNTLLTNLGITYLAETIPSNKSLQVITTSPIYNSIFINPLFVYFVI